jgi:hypothetical protein
VLRSPGSHAGSFLLILEGNGSLARRSADTPFLAIDPAAADLSSVLSPAAAALNAAAGVLEAALGRRLFAFRLEGAALPPCASGSGPCAVWEASSGRVVLDAWLAARMAGGSAAAGAAAAVGSLPAGSQAAALDAASAGKGGSAASRDAAAAGAVGPLDERAGGAGSADSVLTALLVAFVEQLAEQVGEAGVLMRKGAVSLPALAAIFARAGASSVALLMASQVGPDVWGGGLQRCVVCWQRQGLLAWVCGVLRWALVHLPATRPAGATMVVHSVPPGPRHAGALCLQLRADRGSRGAVCAAAAARRHVQRPVVSPAAALPLCLTDIDEKCTAC